MEQEPDPESPLPPPSPAVPQPIVIPPPDLSRPPPPPLSPLESMPRSSPSPGSMPGNAGAKVNLHSGDGGEMDFAGWAVPFNTRAIAAVIDMVVASGIFVGLWMLLPHFAAKLAYLASIAYMLGRDTVPFLGGQSVGKKAMKIKAETLDGKSLVGNWEAACIRNGVLIIPFFAIVELFILLTREDKPERGRRLGDEWAKTKVVIAPITPVTVEDVPPPGPVA